MKYFTKEWCFGLLKDSEIENIEKAYNSYLENIQSEIPFVHKIISKKINFHDGMIKNILFNEIEKTLLTCGIFGDLQIGYFMMKIKYLNVMHLNIKKLSSSVENKEVFILSDEFEKIKKDFYSHRMIFSSKKEIEINFQDVELIFQNADAKNYKKEKCTFKIVK